MTMLEDLRPQRWQRVIDLLDQAGHDTSDWANFKGGARKASVNPKWCYNWAFQQPGEFFVACLWHKHMMENAGDVVHHRTFRYVAGNADAAREGMWRRRAQLLDAYVQLAYRQKLPVKVIVVDGNVRRLSEQPRASQVETRSLDTENWAVVEYDDSTGQCLLVRGALSSGIPLEAAGADDLMEGRQYTRLIIHRHREARARRAKIAEMLQLHGTLVCEVPRCNFDFEKIYGALGKNYAQVHHLDPLSESPQHGRPVDLNRLKIVCANCHAMVHRNGDCLPLDDLIPLAEPR
jgi:hypothetical protein